MKQTAAFLRGLLWGIIVLGTLPFLLARSLIEIISEMF
jgi:membrane-associated HD superfamily phosphohydrolase